MMRSFLVAFVTLALVFPALAYEPGEVLEDPALEERARALSAELRCMVCQNQSIDESNAPLAKDLRILVRDRLVAGDTDTQVIDYVVARYGEYVLLRPRVAPHTYVLWFGPFIILLLAGALSLRYVVRKRSAEAGGEDTSLSTDEQTRINQLMNEGRQN
ncbi:cytochrome c-type biogenesis protein [Pyruvatibacter sp.]|uniref:cytochrome c-type biogenesis protein n=1 Tax=Pyruvatibacter sp. TaxID=1981328 RepID=UPI0032EDFA53